ncbi:hypothetical protein [Silvanigrella aquatica]|uniref:Abnormal spindle-like microcephaly-associated protein ASH domain-containing protein n=1 Tax=Silvanigrella aquatica TaxID=1915309 RepID=A0A1L4CXF8_9BACT|nr:hypothetical protein [Silvanigrella aquatica]APJ02630.1 hypothetical protein AXG55_01255 [Silvanigrella aquatica]
MKIKKNNILQIFLFIIWIFFSLNSCIFKNKNAKLNKNEVDISSLSNTDKYSIKTQIGRSAFLDIPITNVNNDILKFLDVVLQNNLDSMKIYSEDCSNISLQKNANCNVVIKFNPTYPQKGIARLSLIYSNKYNKKLQYDIFVNYNSIQPKLFSENIYISSISEKNIIKTIKFFNKGSDKANIIFTEFENNPENFKITSNKCLNHVINIEDYCEIDISYQPIKAETGELEFKIIYLDSDLHQFDDNFTIYYSSSEPLLYSENYELKSPLGKEVKKDIVIKNIGNEKAVILNTSLFNNKNSLSLLHSSCSFGQNLKVGESCNISIKFKPLTIEDNGVSFFKIEYLSSNKITNEKLINLNYSAKDALIDSVDSLNIFDKNGFSSRIIKIINNGNSTVKVDSFRLISDINDYLINYEESSCNLFNMTPYSFCSIKIANYSNDHVLKDFNMDLLFNYIDSDESKYLKLFHLSHVDDSQDLVEPLRSIASIYSEVGIKKIFKIKLYNKGNDNAKINSISLSGNSKFLSLEKSNLNCEHAIVKGNEYCNIEIVYRPLNHFTGKAFLNLKYTGVNNKVYNRSFEIQLSSFQNKNLLLDLNGKAVKYCRKYEFVKADNDKEYLKNLVLNNKEYFVMSDKGEATFFEFLPKNVTKCSSDLSENYVHTNDIVNIKGEKTIIGVSSTNKYITVGINSQFRIKKVYDHFTGYSIFILDVQNKKNFMSVGCSKNNLCGVVNNKYFMALKTLH